VDRISRVAWTRAALLAIVSLGLSGCSVLPSAGPSASEVAGQADHNTRFALVEVNDDVLKAIAGRPVDGFASAFGRYGAPPEQKIEVGDVVGVSIWEAGGGSLFGQSPLPSSGTTAPRNTSELTTVSPNTTILPQRVTEDGGISVPFAGRVQVSGATVTEAQNRVLQRLKSKAIDPQVVLVVEKSPHNTATVAGEVVNGSRVALSPGGDRILDVIAEGQGAKAPDYELYVKLSRNGTTATIPYQRLVDNPAENIFVWPGDTIVVEKNPEVFQAFGATGAQNAQIDFGRAKLSVLQALAKASGLLDPRADPQGLFLLRFESIAIAQSFNVPLPQANGTGIVPVVYHFNMNDMKSYFLAQQFPVRNEDILYIANSPSTPTQKLFGLIGSLVAPAATGAIVGNQIK
jgi:polysaccharide export outer membrane protein